MKMNSIHTETQEPADYISISFAALSVFAAVLLVILPMLALAFNLIQS